ncbi:MAG: hypothetical protein LQ340_002230 [Diploschistes diacapsis]|nr:MAG: hypothetical protein LQ340_002230 [Diploschistes diacapsis]
MRKLQFSKWSGDVLSPRTRPSAFFFQRIARIQPHRNAASATAIAGTPEVHENPHPPPRNDRSRFQHLPSPPPSAARQSAKLAALHARLHLSPRFPMETLGRCLIDPTADHHPSYNNNSLSILGNDILGYHTTELILSKYPRLPTAVIFAAARAYVGGPALAMVTKEWGVEVAATPGGEVDPGLLQYKRRKPGNAEAEEGTGVLVKDVRQEMEEKVRKPWRRGITSFTTDDSYLGEQDPSTTEEQEAQNLLESGIKHETACSQFVHAVFGAVYIHSGRLAAKNFFNAHIASRKLDFSTLFEFKQPTRDLSRLCAREGFESPVARILSETGRHSRTPVFVVGVFSGNEKLGEGSGASLHSARLKGAISALKGWYLYSPVDVRVPSDAEGGGKEWKPVLVDGGEVIV